MVHGQGQVVLEWDNRGAPWRQVRMLSYTIELLYPEAAVERFMDKARENMRCISAVQRQLSERQEKVQSLNRSLETEIERVLRNLKELKSSREQAAVLESRIERERRALWLRTVNDVLCLVISQGWFDDLH